MNKQQLERNIGTVGRLRPPAKDENDGHLDDDWIIERVTDTSAMLTHVRSGAALLLGLDHIKERMSDPDRDGGDGPRFGFLLLNVEVHRRADGVFVSEPIVPRLGRSVPPREGTSISRSGPTLSWLDIEARFKELRQQEITDAKSGSDRLVSALTGAEPGQPEQWRLMGGNHAIQADVHRLCRIAGGKLKDAKWQRPEDEDFARWIGFVVEVGGHTRHLHGESYGANQPRVERDDYWIRDVVPECIAAVREALAREQIGAFTTPKPQPPRKGLVQLFTHTRAGDRHAVAPQQVESWFTQAGWEVVRGTTSLQIHADGVWIHGGRPSERQMAHEWLLAHGIEARLDEREEDVPVQVIIGREIRKDPAQDTFSAFWKKGGVQSIRVKNRSMETLTGVAVVIDAIEWWFAEHQQWAPCEDGRPDFFPKKLTGGTSRLTPGEEADFTFINEPNVNPPRMQFHEIHGGGLDSFTLERRGHRRVVFRVVSDQRPAFKATLPLQFDKTLTARPSSDPPA